MNDPETALALALEQISRAFGKGSPPAPVDEKPQWPPTGMPEELRRIAEWHALSKEEQDAHWVQWEAESGEPPF